MYDDRFAPSGLGEHLVQDFGREALEAIGAIISWAHIRAPREGAERWGDVGVDRCGVLRWIQIDADLLKLDGSFPGVSVGLFHNDGGGMRHIEVSAGRFRLLVSHDSNVNATVPLSNYGHSLAQSNQMSLFEVIEPAPANPVSSQSYAWLFHSKSADKGEVPACIQIRFPDGKGRYASEHLRLDEMFPNLMDETWLLRASLNFPAAVAPNEEKIREEALPTFRRAPETGTH